MGARLRGEEERSGVGMKRDGERRVVGWGAAAGHTWVGWGGVEVGRGGGVVRGRWA